MVVNSELQPNKSILPFWTSMRPREGREKDYDLQHMGLSKVDYLALLTKSLDQYSVHDMFEEWYNKLGIDYKKKIMLLGHDLAAQKSFLQEWLGYHHIKHFFSDQTRDIKVAALFENDKADFHNRPYPFPKFHLQYMATSLRIERKRPHNSLQDCLVITECYRRMMKASSSSLEVDHVDQVGEGTDEMQDLRI